MAAIVTDALKHQIALNLFTEVTSTTDSNEYFIGIGKTDTYDSSDTTATPLSHQFDSRMSRGNLESIKKITATSFVATRHNWSSGTTYSAWNDKQVGYPTQPYYVLTEDNEVYICIQQSQSATGSANPSTVKPSYSGVGASVSSVFETSDGYRWKYLYSISAGEATNFLTAGFFPTQKVLVDSGAATAFQLLQLNVQNFSIGGQILGAEIVDGGSGYTSAPTIAFRGNGAAAAASATISGGRIVKVTMDNESAGMGSGYDYSSISLSGGGGTGGSLRPIIGPRDGFGFDARKDLKSSSVLSNVKADGTETGTFNITNDYRQILVLKNLDLTDSASPGGRYSGTSSKVNRQLTLTTDIATNGFSVDEIITGGTSGVTAFVDEVDSASGFTIRFHQNEKTQNGHFQNSEALTGNLGGSGTIDSGNLFSPVDIYSGDLLYIENRARIVRSSSQTEDLKVILTV